MKKSKFGYLWNILIAIILIAGVILLLYPTVSDYWNSFHQSKAITSYAEKVETLEEAAYDQMMKEAKAFNASILERDNVYKLTEEEEARYHELLDLSGLGVMGYVEVPLLNCSLPIYHGTSDSVLQVAIGHIEWTSLPVGGKSSHCVISGHRGLPRAKLFTDLDKMAVGDVFMLRTLDEVLTYEVDQISIVKPQDTKKIEIVEGEDYCTLVTCTPYGINSHRLLVRGHRIENIDARTVFVTADAIQIDPVLVAPIVAVPILMGMLVWLLVKTRKKR